MKTTLTKFLMNHIYSPVHAINELYNEGYLHEEMSWLEEFRADLALERIKKGLNHG